MLENCNPNSTQKLKRLLIKLGSKCNLQCKYCHQRKVNYKFNDDILKFLQNCNDLECITFSGGEPLLFKSEIQKIIDTVKDKNVQFKIVTNGTLFNNDTIDWINRNNIVIGMSFDGFKNLRGMTADFTALDEIKNFSGVSTVVTNKFNWDDFVNDIAQLVNDTGRNLLAIPNFVHQTKEAPNFDLCCGHKLAFAFCGHIKQYRQQFFLASATTKLLVVLFQYGYLIGVKPIGKRPALRQVFGLSVHQVVWQRGVKRVLNTLHLKG